ncbi:uncharacterized protein F5147DRAFT_774765 [Suillus discolor]|uniref:Uncharacterized protein n=1 Tax=Suillus discolor TaxID=1912936 RepID=A0A9P7F5Y7_9AGAM|nr:uncharacterized protein F5147DRAFT_774765 [Suillus discolor]KAG2106774.1 hypothetical protein F5147DRAFT_774765 [Suillus discolor]
MLQLTFFKDSARGQQPSSHSTTTASGTSTTHSNVHEGDITHFAQVGFDALVQSLAVQQGFQVDVIRTVYKYLSSYEKTVEVIEAMREAAEVHTIAEILSRTEDDDVEDNSIIDDSVKEDSVKSEEEE